MIYQNDFSGIAGETSLCVGNFDGLHKGHRKLIEKAVSLGLKSVVMSFSPHPAEFFSGTRIAPILSKEEKLSILSSYGVDYYVEYPFSAKFAGMSPDEFAAFLHGEASCKALTVGEGFKFSKGRSGDVDILARCGGKYGIKVFSLPHAVINGVKISSTDIRESLKTGDLFGFEMFTGRKYCIAGIVEKGKRLGREIGFPTVNISEKDKLLPRNGVYATITEFSGISRFGMTNVGINPTVPDGIKKVETHIFDYSGKELYGERITVKFYKYIRGETNFGSLEALANRLAVDEKTVKKYFEENV